MRSMKLFAAAALAAAGSMFAGAAHAGGNVWWSIDIRAPLDAYGSSIGTSISNAPRPVYRPAPVVYAPPPMVVAPAPVYYVPAPVVYAPPPRVVYAPVVYRPARTLPAPVYVPHRHRHHGRDD